MRKYEVPSLEIVEIDVYNDILNTSPAGQGTNVDTEIVLDP